MSKAVYTASKNNPECRDVALALDYLNDILENAPYDEIMPHVLRLKAKYLSMSARYDEAREVLKQVFALIPPHPTPEFKQCLDMAQALEKSIAKMEEYKRMDDEYKAMKERRRVEKQNRINQQSN